MDAYNLTTASTSIRQQHLTGFGQQIATMLLIFLMVILSRLWVISTTEHVTGEPNCKLIVTLYKGTNTMEVTNLSSQCDGQEICVQSRKLICSDRGMTADSTFLLKDVQEESEFDWKLYGPIIAISVEGVLILVILVIVINNSYRRKKKKKESVRPKRDDIFPPATPATCSTDFEQCVVCCKGVSERTLSMVPMADQSLVPCRKPPKPPPKPQRNPRTSSETFPSSQPKPCACGNSQSGYQSGEYVPMDRTDHQAEEADIAEAILSTLKRFRSYSRPQAPGDLLKSRRLSRSVPSLCGALHMTTHTIPRSLKSPDYPQVPQAYCTLRGTPRALGLQENVRGYGRRNPTNRVEYEEARESVDDALSEFSSVSFEVEPRAWRSRPRNEEPARYWRRSLQISSDELKSLSDFPIGTEELAIQDKACDRVSDNKYMSMVRSGRRSQLPSLRQEAGPLPQLPPSSRPRECSPTPPPIYQNLLGPLDEYE